MAGPSQLTVPGRRHELLLQMSGHVEPGASLGSVSRVRTDADSGQLALATFYAASYARTVGVVGAVLGDKHEAEEVVQEAFSRLVSAWDKVERYDEPEAWVRQVALRVASSRRRKAQNGLRALLRLGPSPDVAPVSAVAVDLERAVASLPVKQRVVVVLHELGLDDASIAQELRIPVGTVKSRLSRSRSALAQLLEGKDGHDRSTPATRR